MPLNFPDNPQQNDTFTVNGRTYTYRGNRWRRTKARLADVSPTLDVANDFTAGGALHVDSDTGRVGIGTANPQYELHVDGTGEVTGDFQVGQNLDVTGTVDINGLRLTSDGSTISLSEVLAGTYSTQAATTNDDTLATTAFVQNAIANLVDSAPGTLNTLNELAAALDDDPNFATTVTNNIALKLDSSAYTAADVLAKLLTVDGSGSSLDADTLDGSHASAFAASSHTHSYAATNHTHSYLPTSGGTLSGQLTMGTSASIRQSSSTWTGNPGSGVGKLEYHSNRWYIVAGSNSTELLRVRRDNSDKFVIDNNGSISVGSVPWARLTGVPSYASSSHNHDSLYYKRDGTYTTSDILSFQSNDNMRTSSGSQAALQVYQDNANADAFMTFHVAGDYALYFGLDGGTNELSVGGWSMGSTAYKIWHAGNCNNYSTDWYQDSSYCDNWHRSTGNTGFYHESHGGGWFMQDSTWLRSYNSKNVYTNGGKLESRYVSTSNDWSAQPFIGTSSQDIGLAIRSYDSDTHTAQLRAASGTWYARNHNDTAYWTVAAFWYNPSSRTLKQDISSWGEMKPLSSAVNTTYDTTATDLMKQLRVVSYRHKKQNALPADISNERRSEALDRLNSYRLSRGLDTYDGEEAVHKCGRDCEGSDTEPCDLYRNWELGTIGFIAEEVAEVIPEATNIDLYEHSPTKGTNAALDPMALIALLTKTLQETESRLSALEARLT